MGKPLADYVKLPEFDEYKMLPVGSCPSPFSIRSSVKKPAGKDKRFLLQNPENCGDHPKEPILNIPADDTNGRYLVLALHFHLLRPTEETTYPF